MTDEVEETQQEVPKLSDEEMDVLVRRVVSGEVYASNSADGLESFRLVLAYGGEKLGQFVDSIGMVYEEMSKALPRPVNGYPMFTSCKFLHRDQLVEFLRRVELLEARIHAPLGNEGGDG
jgi:hypothetical protein